MAAVATAEGLAILLLAVLVAGLLRSHADILRRLHDLGAGIEDPAGAARPLAVLRPTAGPVAPPRAAGEPAPDVTGWTPSGDPVVIAVSGGRRTLLAFFSSGCATCAGLWRQLRDAGVHGLGLPTGTRVVVVTRGPGEESESEVARLAAPDIPVVMSAEAWEDYRVPASPYFVLVDGDPARIAGEGAVRRWDELAGLAGQALDDRRSERAVWDRRQRERDADRERRADEALRAAGILPGDPRLYHPTAAGEVPAEPGSLA